MAQRAAGTAIDHDGGANLNATVVHLGGYGRGGRLVPQLKNELVLEKETDSDVSTPLNTRLIAIFTRTIF